MKYSGILFFILFPLLVSAQLSSDNYKVYSVKKGKEVKLKEIIRDMKKADVLFFGEEHNDSVGHYLEHTLFKMLHEKYGDRIALSLEMFDRDVQFIMDEYLNHGIREKHFRKDARVWSNYSDYRPMVEYAKQKGLDVVCANAASRYTNLVGREGQEALMELSDEAKRYIAPLPYETASGEYYDKLMSFMSGGHEVTDSTKKAAATHFGGFDLITAQSLWDATMAWSIASYLSGKEDVKVFQVNGRFHSDENFAIVTQLKKYRPEVKTLVISSGSEDDFTEPDWDSYKHLGDYIIITDPEVPRTYESGF